MEWLLLFMKIFSAFVYLVDATEPIDSRKNPFLAAPYVESGPGHDYLHKGRLARHHDLMETFYQFPPFFTDPHPEQEPTHSRNSCLIETVSEGNSCPGHYGINEKENRVPRRIAEWRCSCQHCRLPMRPIRRSSFRCKPIYQVYQTLWRNSSAEEYQLRQEKISVGCQCEEHFRYRRDTQH